MDENLRNGDREPHGTGARARGLRFIRSRLLASTIIAFAIAGGFHGIERHFDHQLEKRDAIVCQDLNNLNNSRVHELKIKLHCDR